MNKFPQKHFNGTLYTLAHLNPMQVKVPLDIKANTVIDLHITFGCHCFTETFVPTIHAEHHRYTYKGELRAFSQLRYECSLHLPRVMQSLIKGTIYNANDSYTYVAHIKLHAAGKPQNYSVFFSLKNVDAAVRPALSMFVKSAYLRPCAAKPNAQSWRFASLAGQITGMFPTKPKHPRPQKKKKAP